MLQGEIPKTITPSHIQKPAVKAYKKEPDITVITVFHYKIQVLFLYCCTDCSSCPAHLDRTGWATWAIPAANKEIFSLSATLT